MENHGAYNLTVEPENIRPEDVYEWWNCDLDELRKKKKKKKRKKKKSKGKAKKKAKRELKYRLVEKSADTFLRTASDVIRIYAENKFRANG